MAIKPDQIDMLEESKIPGVGVVRDRKIESLADELADLNTQKKELSDEVAVVEKKLVDRMMELHLAIYRANGRNVELKELVHAKVKINAIQKVKAEASGN